MMNAEVPINKRRVVVVWERRPPQRRGGQPHYWQPYSAEVSHLVERSFQNNLASINLGDGSSVNQRDHQQKVIHFDSSLERRIDDSSSDGGVPVRRSIYSADSGVAKGITWQWFDDLTNRWRLYSVDVQDEIEKAYQSAESAIDLSKSVCCPLPYVIDFATKMQRRKLTGTRRPIRRSEDRPYPPVHVSDASVLESSGLLRRSERIANRTTSLPKKNDENLAALTTATMPLIGAHQVSEKNGDKLQSVPANSTEKTQQGFLSSIFSNWLKMPLFRTTSSPELSVSPNVPAKSSNSSVMRKKNRMTSFISRHNKRPTHKNPCIVASESSTQHDVVTAEDLLRKYGAHVSTPSEENCTVCYDSLRSPSAYDDGDSLTLQLTRCGHVFHAACLKAMIGSRSSAVTYLQCPTCKVIYGRKIGNQPPGQMMYFIIRKPLPGYEGEDTICIMYDFSNGIQDESHPTPNQRYTARTFPRACYLPDDEKGRKVLRLLMVAWQRRLTFTIGSSVTTGQDNVVTWNEIHHKTEFGSNMTGHGYPDPNYLDNVLLELATQGVFDDGE